MTGLQNHKKIRSAVEFLTQAGWQGARRTPLAGDASFRRYERLDAGEARAVLMDAPPPHEDVRPFLAVTGWLERAGLSAPRLLGAAIAEGFLLLEDLGDDRYSRVIAGAPELELPLYQAAADLLVELHGKGTARDLPVGGQHHHVADYDEALLIREARLFTDWYLPGLYQAPPAAHEKQRFDELWRAAFRHLENTRPVMVLRDYHADNLMWLPEREGTAKVGLLDYQDAVIGHPAYDLVSLLQDARRVVPPALESAMIERYLKGSAAAGRSLDGAAFRAAYAILGAQRNTKIIGIFTRLWMRDGKAGYLNLIPRVWGLLERDLEHPLMREIAHWFNDFIDPETRKLPPPPGRWFDRPDNAMILAAGLGTRMRPLTDHLPKPLLEVAGRSLIDRTLDHLAEAGVSRAVINVHFMADRMMDHLALRKAKPAIVVSDETNGLLDSGGGVAKALAFLGSEPFYILNSDMIWDDARFDSLGRLAGAWDDTAMDALLLLVPTERAIGYDGKGDFELAADGRLTRRGVAAGAPYMFSGIELVHPRLFAGAPQGAFSLNLLFDQAIAGGRIFGIIHQGGWRHVGTPDACRDAHQALSEAGQPG